MVNIDIPECKLTDVRGGQFIILIELCKLYPQQHIEDLLVVAKHLTLETMKEELHRKRKRWVRGGDRPTSYTVHEVLLEGNFSASVGWQYGFEHA